MFFFACFFWEVSSRHRGTLVIIQLSWIPKPSRVSGWPRYLDYPVVSIDFNRSTQLLPLTGPRILGGAGLNAGDKIWQARTRVNIGWLKCFKKWDLIHIYNYIYMYLSHWDRMLKLLKRIFPLLEMDRKLAIQECDWNIPAAHLLEMSPSDGRASDFVVPLSQTRDSWYVWLVVWNMIFMTFHILGMS